MDSSSRTTIIRDLERGKHDQYDLENPYEYDSDSIPSITAAGLIGILSRYDGQLEPHFGSDDGLQLSTIVIAIMTVYRVALGSVVESALSQCAWIWVSAARQERKEKTEPARLEDFKMFDEASRGLLGCLSLIWRLRGCHLACVGAGIIILMQGFETFSQQMVTFEETPTPQLNDTNSFAPPPARSETWHNVIFKGVGGDLDLGLSTKASFYDGIMASSISELPVYCGTANCTWPTFPSLAVCGNCTSVVPQKTCPADQPCAFSLSSGTSVTAPGGDSTGLHFTVAPSMNISAASSSQAYLSKFDVLSVSKGRTEMTAEAWQCSMWFCLNSYNVVVTTGQQNTTTVGTWSRTEFSAATSAHDDEYHFVDIPEDMKANARTRYSVPLESIDVLGNFMASKMIGNYSNIDNHPDYSSDWIQAMQNATSDMSAMMSRLTLSMTNDIRISGTLDPNNRGNMYEYVGAAYTQRPFVQVNWYWVIYPVMLMILAFLYLIQTVWRTARDHVCAWKGDSLPMLFAHIDKGIHQVVANGMDVPGGLTDRIGRTQIELIRRQNGQWLFKLPQRAVKRRRMTAAGPTLVIQPSQSESY
ncbi:hypothetical protein E8E14_010235 [Neopestalotiopsis sp. 37M]|nr:hypothetical protein E8E14_010235 [Neopestalotiopsis sp. 37M]